MMYRCCPKCLCGRARGRTAVWLQLQGNKHGNRWSVEPNERQITNLHCNLRHAQKITFRGETKQLEAGYLGWAFGRNEYKF